MNKFESIYNKLDKLGILAIRAESAKSKSGGFMDLNFDRLGTRDMNSYSYDIALAHNYIQNGDVMADPDMEIRIYPAGKLAEALSFQMSNPPIYQVVYPSPGKVYPKLKRELNSFLNQWLSNCIQQGHKFEPVTQVTEQAAA